MIVEGSGRVLTYIAVSLWRETEGKVVRRARVWVVGTRGVKRGRCCGCGCVGGSGWGECTQGLVSRKMMDGGAGGDDCFAAPN